MPRKEGFIVKDASGVTGSALTALWAACDEADVASGEVAQIEQRGFSKPRHVCTGNLRG